MLLHSVTFDSKAVIVEEQEPVRVELMVISLQLVEIEVLQPASVDPTEDAKEADLVEGLIRIVKKNLRYYLLFEDVEEHDGSERFPPTISVRIRASFMNIVLLEFFFLTMLAIFSALFSCFLKLYTWL